MSEREAIRDFYNLRGATPSWVRGEDGDYTILESLFVFVFIDAHPEISVEGETFLMFDKKVSEFKITAFIYDEICYYVRNDTAAIAERIKDALKLQLYMNNYFIDLADD